MTISGPTPPAANAPTNAPGCGPGCLWLLAIVGVLTVIVVVVALATGVFDPAKRQQQFMREAQAAVESAGIEWSMQLRADLAEYQELMCELWEISGRAPFTTEDKTLWMGHALQITPGNADAAWAIEESARRSC